MTQQDIGAAIGRLKSIFRRRPEAGLVQDPPAAARWEGGTRVVTTHACGKQAVTDMPIELGGTGDQVTPGWLFRAALASCGATSIVLAAAADGITLSALEVHASSRSDARGLLGMEDASGTPVFAGPGDVQLDVRIVASGIDAQRLRALVERCLSHSPVPSAVTTATALALHIEIVAT